MLTLLACVIGSMNINMALFRNLIQWLFFLLLLSLLRSQESTQHCLILTYLKGKKRRRELLLWSIKDACIKMACPCWLNLVCWISISKQ